MNKLQKGFTLIELLISIVLLSLITIITTSILQNSIIQRNIYLENSNYLEKYNSFFGILRDDFRFIQNMDMLNVNGESSFKTLFLNDDEKQLSFITKSYLNDDLELRNIRVLYFTENEKLYRREYKSINPADFNDYLDVLVLNEITDIRISAHNKQRWLNVWPYDEVSKKKLPHAVSISITQRQEEVFEIILATNNDNAI
jgi:type II secretion system protein J